MAWYPASSQRLAQIILISCKVKAGPEAYDVAGTSLAERDPGLRSVLCRLRSVANNLKLVNGCAGGRDVSEACPDNTANEVIELYL